MDTTAPSLNVEKFRTPDSDVVMTPEEIAAKNDAIRAKNNAIMKNSMMNSAILNMQANQHTAIGDMTANASGESQDDKVTSDDYDMEVLKSYHVFDLNLLETMSLRKTVLKQLNNLKACQGMLKAVEDIIQMENNPTINRDVMATNYLDAYGFGDLNLEKFNKLYEEFEPMLQQLLDKCDTRMKALREAGVSTKTLTEDMISLLEKKMASIPSGATNHDFEVKKLQRIIEAYRTRDAGLLAHFDSKVSTFADNKKNVRNLKRAALGTPSDIAGKLMGHYDQSTLTSFMVVCKALAPDNEGRLLGCGMSDAELVAFLYILNRMFASDAAENNHVWVDLIISNFVDIRSGIFDITDPFDWMVDFREVVRINLSVLGLILEDNGISDQILKFIRNAEEYDAKRREEIIKKMKAEQATQAESETEEEAATEPTGEEAIPKNESEPADPAPEAETPAVGETEE